MIFDKIPYTNFHEMNLDWILRKVQEMETQLDNFTDLNAIAYHDPIGWNITTQYKQNEIVKDPNTGMLYLSKKPVPTGISLTNTDYWLEIGNMSVDLTFLKEAICVTDEGYSLTATQDYAQYDFLWWQDKLYMVTAAITTGQPFDPGTNMDVVEISDLLNQLYSFNNALSSALQAYINTNSPANSFYGGSIKVFGDSNTVVNYITETNRFYATVARTLGMTYDCYGVSNTCFQDNVDNGGGGYRGYFRTQIANAPADDNCKIVIILGGINDFHYGTYDEANFASAVSDTVRDAAAKYPNATIVTMMDCGSQAPNGKMLRYAKLVQRYGTNSTSTLGTKCVVVPSVDMFSNSQYWYNSNHYSQMGNNAIARRIVSTLIGNGLANYSGVVRTNRSYTSASPNTQGFYNCGYDVTTYVDPLTCTRQDDVMIEIDPGFANSDARTEISNGTVIFDDIPALCNDHGQDSMTTDYIVQTGVRQSSGVNTFRNFAFSYQGNNYNSVTEDPKLTFKLQYKEQTSNFNVRTRCRMHFLSY